MKIRFNPSLERELLWKDSVDATAKFSATFPGFAKVIFVSWIGNGSAIKEIETARAGIRQSDFRFVFLAVPIQVVSDRQKTLQRILLRAISSG
jgi:hypothetical protein